MKKLAVAVVLASTIAVQSAAFAGAVFSAPITVGTNIAYGSLKTARFSANTREHIGCGVNGVTGD